jgi:hypothetical protein
MERAARAAGGHSTPPAEGMAMGRKRKRVRRPSRRQNYSSRPSRQRSAQHSQPTLTRQVRLVQSGVQSRADVSQHRIEEQTTTLSNSITATHHRPVHAPPPRACTTAPCMHHRPAHTGCSLVHATACAGGSSLFNHPRHISAHLAHRQDPWLLSWDPSARASIDPAG